MRLIYKMSSTKRILLLTEGEVLEKQLFDHIYSLYDVGSVTIIPYKTNLYSFYHRLFNDFQIDGEIDFEAIDLPLFLNDYLKLGPDKKLNAQDFSDILLVFDYDPHDSSYSHEKIKILLQHFSETSDKGKLYINYPMIESFHHITSLSDSEFNNRKEKLQNLKLRYGKSTLYKKIVRDSTFISKISDLSLDEMNMLIKMHDEKLKKILANCGPKDFSEEDRYLELCDIQSDELDENEEMWVINTSVLYMLEEYGGLTL